MSCVQKLFLTLVLVINLFATSSQAAPRCDFLFYQPLELTSLFVNYRHQPIKMFQNIGEIRKSVLASELAPEIPVENKLIVGFLNGHVYLYHNGLKADSWGRPPFIVSAKPKIEEHLTGQFFVVLNDRSGSLQQRYLEAFNDFTNKSDRTCVRLACQFLKDLYPDQTMTKQITPEQFLEKILLWQSPETYSAQVYVTGSENFAAAMKAQKTNQLKAVRNAAVGLGIPVSLILLASQILF